MKIYQIHEHGGQWGDSFDYIDSSYLNKETAELKMKELNEQKDLSMMCSNCPLWYCPENCEGECGDCDDYIIERAKSFCDRCDVEYYKNDDSECVECKNRCTIYEESSFKIVEVEVVE